MHDDTEKQAQQRWIHQMAGNPHRGRFPTESPLERELRLEIQREQLREDVNKRLEWSRENIALPCEEEAVNKRQRTRTSRGSAVQVFLVTSRIQLNCPKNLRNLV